MHEHPRESTSQSTVKRTESLSHSQQDCCSPRPRAPPPTGPPHRALRPRRRRQSLRRRRWRRPPPRPPPPSSIRPESRCCRASSSRQPAGRASSSAAASPSRTPAGAVTEATIGTKTLEPGEWCCRPRHPLECRQHHQDVRCGGRAAASPTRVRHRPRRRHLAVLPNLKDADSITPGTSCCSTRAGLNDYDYQPPVLNDPHRHWTADEMIAVARSGWPCRRARRRLPLLEHELHRARRPHREGHRSRRGTKRCTHASRRRSV